MRVKSDSRTCFGIDYYDDEAEAERVGAAIRESGGTYNGGFFHGKPCGREPERDITDAGGRKLYAVTKP